MFHYFKEVSCTSTQFQVNPRWLGTQHQLKISDPINRPFCVSICVLVLLTAVIPIVLGVTLSKYEVVTYTNDAYSLSKNRALFIERNYVQWVEYMALVAPTTGATTTVPTMLPCKDSNLNYCKGESDVQKVMEDNKKDYKECSTFDISINQNPLLIVVYRKYPDILTAIGSALGYVNSRPLVCFFVYFILSNLRIVWKVKEIERNEACNES
jgi:hypothetical protein